jgi:hypothetical protein
MKKAEFERIVTKTFRGLEARHGFKRGEAEYTKKSYSMHYLNATTDVTVNYEFGGEPWLAVTDRKNPENRSTLGWLLVERGITKEPVPADAFRSINLSEQDFTAILEREKQQLLEYGMEFINGDFSIMPALQKRAQKYALDCEHYIAIYKSK